MDRSRRIGMDRPRLPLIVSVSIEPGDPPCAVENGPLTWVCDSVKAPPLKPPDPETVKNERHDHGRTERSGAESHAERGRPLGEPQIAERRPAAPRAGHCAKRLGPQHVLRKRRSRQAGSCDQHARNTRHQHRPHQAPYTPTRSAPRGADVHHHGLSFHT